MNDNSAQRRTTASSVTTDRG